MIASGTILGWGRAQPEELLTNEALEATLDTSDEWIRERTGIIQRHVGGRSTDLAVEAARRTLDSTAAEQRSVPEVDLVLVATSTPDRVIPSTASAVVTALGLTAGAIDLNAACAGFVYGLVHAYGALALGARSVLVIGVDAMSRITDPSDRSTAILFGDGAGAVLLSAGGEGGLLGWGTGSDPTTESILGCPAGGFIEMKGQSVFKVAVREAIESISSVLDSAGLKAGDVDLFIPHQANQRITDAIARKLGFDATQVVSTIGETGNTSAGTVPWSLCAAAEAGRIRDGDVVVVSGFGAGMTWATAALRWDTR